VVPCHWQNQRLGGPFSLANDSYMPPTEFEQIHYRHQQTAALVVGNQ
jgi:hypothetical protein